METRQYILLPKIRAFIFNSLINLSELCKDGAISLYTNHDGENFAQVSDITITNAQILFNDKINEIKQKNEIEDEKINRNLIYITGKIEHEKQLVLEHLQNKNIIQARRHFVHQKLLEKRRETLENISHKLISILSTLENQVTHNEFITTINKTTKMLQKLTQKMGNSADISEKIDKYQETLQEISDTNELIAQPMTTDEQLEEFNTELEELIQDSNITEIEGLSPLAHGISIYKTNPDINRSPLRNLPSINQREERSQLIQKGKSSLLLEPN